MVNSTTIIVAGAGIWGCTIARRLADIGKNVLLIDSRNCIGGNSSSKIDTATGIEIHSYGSHIFHTSLPDVWSFVTRFSSFNNYRHQVHSIHDGNEYHLPIGRTLIKEFIGRDASISACTESEKAAVFDAFISGYTMKQWGIKASNVPKNIIERLKVRDTYSTDYFDDINQGIPLGGYHNLFMNMVASDNITTMTNARLVLDNTDRRFIIVDSRNNSRIIDVPECSTVYYSGAVDSLFDYCNGSLSWRSLKFELSTLDIDRYQACAVVNYPDLSVDYTRIHEFKHYRSNIVCPMRTVIMHEYPVCWRRGMERYYPVSTEQSKNKLNTYKSIVDDLNTHRTGKLILGGRLGSYRYLDMDKAIKDALDTEV